jgi:prepilin peptidase CpaA
MVGLLACEPSLPLWAALMVVAAISAWFDWRTGCIPNWITLGAILLGLAGQAGWGGIGGGWAGAGAGLLRGATGAVLAGGVPLWLFHRRAMGGGDVKLLVGTGVLGGVIGGVTVELYAFLLAAAYVVVRLGWRGRLLRLCRRSLRLLSTPPLPNAPRAVEDPGIESEVRFAPFVFAGVCLVATSGAAWT